MRVEAGRFSIEAEVGLAAQPRGSLGQFGGNAIYSGSFVVSGATRGLRNTGLNNILATPTTAAPAGVAPAGDGQTTEP